jgi:hypothetical protein
VTAIENRVRERPGPLASVVSDHLVPIDALRDPVNR